MSLRGDYFTLKRQELASLIMHIRESQNVITHRAVNEAAQALPVIHRTAQAAARITPAPAQDAATVLRAGVQNIEDAVLGK